MERYLTPEEQRLQRAKKRIKDMKGFYKHLMAYILVNVFLLALAYFRLEENEEYFKFSTFSTRRK